MTVVLIVTVVAATAEWEDPCAVAATLARTLAGQELKVAVIDTAPSVHRACAVLNVQTFEGLEELVRDLREVPSGPRPADRIVGVEAEGWGVRPNGLGRIWAHMQECGFDIAVVCCAAERGGWLRELLNCSHALILLAGAVAEHGADLVRLVPLTEAPRYFLVSTRVKSRNLRDPNHPEQVAALVHLPLEEVLTPGPGVETALTRFAGKLLRDLGASRPAQPEPESDPEPAHKPQRKPEEAQAMPVDTPRSQAGDSVTVQVPVLALPAVQALLNTWALREEVTRHAVSAGESVRQLRTRLALLQEELGSTEGAQDEQHISQHFEEVLRLRAEVARHKAESRRLQEEYDRRVQELVQSLRIGQPGPDGQAAAD